MNPVLLVIAGPNGTSPANLGSEAVEQFMGALHVRARHRRGGAVSAHARAASGSYAPNSPLQACSIVALIVPTFLVRNLRLLQYYRK